MSAATARQRQAVSRRGLLKGAGLTGAATALGLGVAATGELDQARRLVFLTDLHAGPELPVPLALERAATAINSHHPELIIGGGDLISEGMESQPAAVAPRWQVVLDFFGRLQAPVLPVIGNHDLVAVQPAAGNPPSPEPRSVFRDLFGLAHTYRSLETAGCHLVLLDSVRITGNPAEPYRGEINNEQLCWLQDDLARVEPGTPLVVVSHLPLLTALYQATNGATAPAPADRVVINNLHVLELLQPHHPVLVLQGHLHVNELLRWRDMTVVTGGALCGRWWQGPWHGTEPGFGVVTLANGHFDWQYHTYDWQFDQP